MVKPIWLFRNITLFRKLSTLPFLKFSKVWEIVGCLSVYKSSGNVKLLVKVFNFVFPNLVNEITRISTKCEELGLPTFAQTLHKELVFNRAYSLSFFSMQTAKDTGYHSSLRLPTTNNLHSYRKVTIYRIIYTGYEISYAKSYMYELAWFSIPW